MILTTMPPMMMVMIVQFMNPDIVAEIVGHFFGNANNAHGYQSVLSTPLLLMLMMMAVLLNSCMLLMLQVVFVIKPSCVFNVSMLCMMMLVTRVGGVSRQCA